jgi:hypothetical protein
MRGPRAVSKKYRVAGFDIGRANPQVVQELRFKAVRCASSEYAPTLQLGMFHFISLLAEV